MSSLVRALGGRRLRILFENMLLFPGTYNRGMPDLVFFKLYDIRNDWNRDDVFFVEVKSSCDSLSIWQTCSMKLLETADISTRIFKVK
jgi:hypothetical protein